jgi:NAD(P)-dependent dehydrogenase (short-subunit alcohol dehydrogenase family)
MPGGLLQNQVTLITGAGRGIGRASALRFAREGAKVVICARTRRAIDQVATEIEISGGTVLARVADISKPEAVRGLVRAATHRFGRIDVLVNNAGILGPRVPLAHFTIRDWTRVLSINLTGTFLVTHAVLQYMIAQRHGCIVSLSSSVGRKGRAGWGAYAVSKFGVEGLSQTLAQELEPFGIRIMTYNPGGTRTQMRSEAYPEEDPSRLRDPDEVAEDLLRLATRTSMKHSGTAFDRDTLPSP